MSCYSDSITPDSFSGIVFALEGVSRSIVLINGPSGCKYYHSAVSDNQTLRQYEFDPFNYSEKWYFGQPRVPCTYLDSDDYIYGSTDKLTEALEFLRDNAPFDLLCIVNSPGAALIGDDLRGIAGRIIKEKSVVIIETPDFSRDICTGYETAAAALLDSLPLNSAARSQPNTVNILGLSIFHKYFAGDILELRRLLGLCGVTVNCFLCADCDIDTIRRIPEAALNIVIHPEYGMKTARYLKERYGTPFYLCDGPPIGFSATEKLMGGICTALGCDSSLFRRESERARARAYAYISRVNSLTGLPKGVHFAVEGTYSELYAYTDFLVRYFGMIPEALSVLNEGSDCFQERLQALLNGLALPQALDRDLTETDSELVFASGNTIAKLKLRRHMFSGIEISLPSLGYIDVIPKTHLGLQGALMLTEQVLNGLAF